MNEVEGFTVPLAVPRAGTLVEAISATMHPPAIPEHELEPVLGMYGLNRTGRPRNFTLGWRSSIVSIPTSSGRKVVKRYRAGWDEKTIRHEHAILAELQRIDFPAVRLVASTDGQSFVTHDGARYVVFDHVEGRSVAGRYMTDGGRRSLFLHVGDVLARFHSALSDFTPRFEHHLGYVESSAGAPRDLAWHLAAIEKLTRSGASRHSDEVALGELMKDGDGATRERLVELDRLLTGAGLDTGVIHGDFGPHNVIFDVSGRTVVHDLELARVDWRMVDLAGSISRLRADAGRAFLEGYRRMSPAAAADFSVLPLVWEHYRLCGAIQSWHTYTELGDPSRLATARRRLAEAVRLRDEGPPGWIPT